MPITLQEYELVAMLQAGDSRALEYLYDNYSTSLFGVILKIVRDHDVAEDVLQETFTKIWLNRNSYDRTKSTLFTWMLTIARRLGIDRLRSSEFKQRAVNQSLDDFVDMDVLGAEQPFLPEATDLPRLLNSLPPEQKLVLDLMYFHGYTQAEIAEEHNIPLGTVKSRMRIALATLRKIFAE